MISISFMDTMSFYLILFFVLLVITSIKMIYDYNKRGRLTLVGSIVLFIWFYEQGIIVDYASCHSICPHSNNPALRGFGIVLIIFGLVIMVMGMVNFGKFTRTMGIDTKKLITGGLYRYTRNPQYVGYGITIVGMVIGWYTKYAALSIITYFIMSYVTVVIEEKNLAKIYGEDFEKFCNTTPRFIGI